MKSIKMLLAGAAFAALSATPALAQEAPELGVSFNIAAYSDYVWRGVSQTDEKAAIQGGADLSYGMFYAGIWASNVDFNIPGVNEEVDLYFGLKPSFGGIDFDIGVVTYLYPGEDNLNITEFKLAGSHTFEGGASLGLNYFYSPEAGQGGPATNYIELAGSAPLGEVGGFSIAATGAVGNYSGDGAFVDYTNWKIGLTGALESGLSVELAYTDSDLDLPISDGRVFVGVKFAF